jgi:uncharacterized protein (DUF433 family)
MGGRPCIRGMRLTVGTLVDLLASVLPRPVSDSYS